jgi:hypothetical protein
MAAFGDSAVESADDLIAWWAVPKPKPTNYHEKNLLVHSIAVPIQYRMVAGSIANRIF